MINCEFVNCHRFKNVFDRCRVFHMIPTQIEDLLNSVHEILQRHAVAGDLLRLQLPDHVGTDVVQVLLPVDHCA